MFLYPFTWPWEVHLTHYCQLLCGPWGVGCNHSLHIHSHRDEYFIVPTSLAPPWTQSGHSGTGSLQTWDRMSRVCPGVDCWDVECAHTYFKWCWVVSGPLTAVNETGGARIQIVVSSVFPRRNNSQNAHSPWRFAKLQVTSNEMHCAHWSIEIDVSFCFMFYITLLSF